MAKKKKEIDWSKGVQYWDGSGNSESALYRLACQRDKDHARCEYLLRREIPKNLRPRITDFLKLNEKRALNREKHEELVETYRTYKNAPLIPYEQKKVEAEANAKAQLEREREISRSTVILRRKRT